VQQVPEPGAAASAACAGCSRGLKAARVVQEMHCTGMAAPAVPGSCGRTQSRVPAAATTLVVMAALPAHLHVTRAGPPDQFEINLLNQHDC
jgi:hypothetical protein